MGCPRGTSPKTHAVRGITQGWCAEVLLVCVTLVLLLPSFSAGADEAKPLTVYTTNYPLTYFAGRIAGEHADVVFPAPASIDPAFWVPDKKTVAAFQKADLIVLNGATYEKWTDKVSLPQFRVVNTSKEFKDNYIETADAITHSHGMDGDHSHSGTAFTTWLDLEQAAMQARAIMAALARKLPEKKTDLEKNYKALEKELMGLDEEIAKIVSNDPEKALIVSHPIYQYFARRYELNLEAVMWEPGEFPTDEQWQELAYGLEAYPAAWMLWEGEPLEESVEKLKAMGVRSTVFDPCMNTPEDGDFLRVMKQNVENLRAVYK
jgi:zinc transport system substrate-binding protein